MIFEEIVRIHKLMESMISHQQNYIKVDNKICINETIKLQLDMLENNKNKLLDTICILSNQNNN